MCSLGNENTRASNQNFLNAGEFSRRYERRSIDSHAGREAVGRSEGEVRRAREGRNFLVLNTNLLIR